MRHDDRRVFGDERYLPNMGAHCWRGIVLRRWWAYSGSIVFRGCLSRTFAGAHINSERANDAGFKLWPGGIAVFGERVGECNGPVVQRALHHHAGRLRGHLGSYQHRQTGD